MQRNQQVIQKMITDMGPIVQEPSVPEGTMAKVLLVSIGQYELWPSSFLAPPEVDR